MKKIISLWIVFVLCFSFLCSCGKVPTDNAQSVGLNYEIKQGEFHDVSLNKSEFIGVPEYLVCTVKNRIGDPANCDTIFIEKNYDKLYDRYITKNYNDIYQPITAAEKELLKTGHGRWRESHLSLTEIF